MVLVTDKQYYMEPRLVDKLTMMIERLNNEDDNLLIVEGDEGSGKTTFSVEIEYYVAQMTGRKFDGHSIHFDAAKLVDEAKRNYNGCYIWDEPAMEGLNNEWWNENQRNLIKLLMMARKRRHFIIFNFTKFHKFNEYMVRDRPVGMVKVYKRKNIYKGHFLYFDKKALQMLYDNWKRKKYKEYNKFHTFRGTFPNLPDGIIDLKHYNDRKDDAIMSIGNKKGNKDKSELWALKMRISHIPFPLNVKSKSEFARLLGIKASTYRDWANQPNENSPIEGDVSVLKADDETDINTIGYKGESKNE